MNLEDHAQQVLDEICIYDEAILSKKRIYAKLNEGWKKVTRDVFAHTACLHNDITAGTALYTPTGYQDRVLGVQKVQADGIPLRWDCTFSGLKDDTRRTNETGRPRRWSWHIRSPYQFIVALNPTPSESITDGLWVWVWDEFPQVLNVSDSPEIEQYEQDLGRTWAIRTLLLSLKDDRYRVYEREYEREISKLKLMRSGPICSPVPYSTPD